MKLQDMLDYRRWAASMLEEVEQSKKVNVEQYHYLNGWIGEFDRVLNILTCYPDGHVKYKDGCDSLKTLCLSL